ncbi:ABC transporter permease [Robertkochia solimangrovi]|uniref:ABC transporter permease n=1 Tax=Robertkochia solimangrovi TaxID=2213046 RepID=UPI00117CCFB5|nr:ABC transporter permease [Robertkochia solimangrovi]TRZ42859.1 ABC transporter permease [Robertkochia solimangrovi]
MNIWSISIRNISSKPWYSALGLITLTLSITLLFGIQQLNYTVESKLNNDLGTIDLVLGAKGSPLQLVLSSILHIDNPTGNISYEAAEAVQRNPLVKIAVPISYGDNYKGFRIVGTTPDFPTLYNVEIVQGRGPKYTLEVVLGNDVAQKTGLDIGDTFESGHGLAANSLHHHERPMKVVGIYQPSGTVIDRLIVTGLDSVWELHEHHDHEDENSKEAGEEHYNKEITSLLVSFKNLSGLLKFSNTINRNTGMQAAIPRYELDRLFSFVGIGVKTISWIAFLILLLSGLMICLNLIQMVKDRSFDLALYRTYGASHLQLVMMLILEAFILVILALILGYILSQTTIYCVLYYTSLLPVGLPADFWFNSNIMNLIFIVLSVAIIAVSIAIYPVLKLNISKILSHEI